MSTPNADTKNTGSRGEVWWAQLDDRRPVLVLSASAAEVRGIIIVPPAPTIEGVMEDVAIGPSGDMPSMGVVRVAFPRPGFLPCNWIVTLAANDLIARVGTLSTEQLAAIEALLQRAGLSAD